MRALFTTLAILSLGLTVQAAGEQEVPQGPMTLGQCRELALANNKNMKVAGQQVRTAQYQRKEAFAAYLPAIDFAGGYMYNQRDISIFDSDQRQGCP